MKEKVNKIYNGNNIDVLKNFNDNSFCQIITDIPYALSDINPLDMIKEDVNNKSGFMGKSWDVLPTVEMLKEFYRVLKAGGFFVTTFTPRQDLQTVFIYRLMEAGFDVSFSPIYWAYKSGFPKASNHSKVIQKNQGVAMEVVGEKKKLQSYGYEGNNCYGGDINRQGIQNITKPTTPEAIYCDGLYSLSLKPAVEPIIIAQKPHGKAAIETLAKGNTIVLAGEYWLPNNVKIDEAILKSLINEVIADVGYDNIDYNFINLLEPQSIEIQKAVVNKKTIGAGDQGMMFGYACNEAGYLPTGYYWAQELMKQYAEFIKQNQDYKPDAKCQITTNDKNKIKGILMSCQHTEGLKQSRIENDIKDFVFSVLPSWVEKDIYYKNIIINPSGSFVSGGYEADAGLTGRKIINDTYGSFARHGGGAFSGKDPTKVDRSGAYITRYFAKKFVKEGYCSKCEVQISYCIGIAEPFSISVNTFGTSKKSVEMQLAEFLYNEKITPLYIFKKLKLFENPAQLYEASKHGHFTNDLLTWEGI